MDDAMRITREAGAELDVVYAERDRLRAALARIADDAYMAPMEDMLDAGGIARGALGDAPLDAIEQVREQRDDLYAATVNPRRNVARALKALAGESVGGVTAEEFLRDALRDLEHVADLYREYTAD